MLRYWAVSVFTRGTLVYGIRNVAIRYQRQYKLRVISTALQKTNRRGWSERDSYYLSVGRTMLQSNLSWEQRLHFAIYFNVISLNQQMHHTKNTEIVKILLWHVSTKLFNHRTGQTSQNHGQCAMVCLQSYSSNGSTHPIRSYGFPRKDRQTSHNTHLSSQPSYGTTTTTATQQKIKKTMDIWWNAVRKHRWIPPLTTADHKSTLAHRKQQIDVFWLLIKVLLL
jgi:hypothetical protein